MKIGVLVLMSSFIGSISWFPSLLSEVRPTTLAQIIRVQQRHYVRESFGTLAHQCFTDDDLARFKFDDTALKAASNVKYDPCFIGVVLTIKSMPSDARIKLLESSAKPLRQTWAQLGRISREGQTEAGQQAEILVAIAIVESVEALLDLSAEELQQLCGARSC